MFLASNKIPVIRNPESTKNRSTPEVARRDPVNATALFNLGHTQQLTGQFDAAIATYRSVLTLSTGRGEAHYQICTALLLKGDAPAALAEIEPTWVNSRFLERTFSIESPFQK